MLLIKNGMVMDPAGGREEMLDILTDGGRIIRMARHIEVAAGMKGLRVIDAEGRIVAPGLVDVHVHFRDPGFTHKEDILTGARAAARGGFTSIVLMANTKPAVDNEETLRYVLDKGRKTGIRIATCANVTMGMKGKMLTDMEALSQAGAAGFTDDGVPLLDEQIVKQAMEQAAKIGKPISFHEENPAFIQNNGVNAGKASVHYGIGGSDRQAEIDMVHRDLELARGMGADISIQHISTKEAVELIRQEKKMNPHVYAEATPHHFTLTEDAVIKYGTLAKMNPPLREEADRLAIIKGLQDGSIDMIATDHAPHSSEEKNRPITEAPSGIIGLETSLSLGIRELVNKGYVSMLKLLELMALNPARLYQMDAGYLAEGGPADLVIFDRDECWRVEGYESKSSNSPFTGETLPGVVYYTICNGMIVYEKQCQQ